MKTSALFSPARTCKAGVALFGTTAVLATGVIGLAPAQAEEAPAAPVATATAEPTVVESATPVAEQTVVATEAPAAAETPVALEAPAAPTAAEPTATATPTESTRAAEAPIKDAAAATAADQFNPSWAPITIAVGGTGTAAYTGDNITVPAVALATKPEGWQGSYDDANKSFSFTVPADLAPGEYTVPVAVGYGDGSVDKTSIVVTVTGAAASTSDSEKYSPSWDKGTITPGGTTTLKYTGDEILTEATANGQTPEGWTITRAPDSRDFIVTAPADVQPGFQLVLPITVTYGDGTTDSATLTVDVVADAVAPAPVETEQPAPAPVETEQPAAPVAHEAPAPAQPAAPVAETPAAPAPAPTQAAPAVATPAPTPAPALAHTGATSIAVLSGAGLLLLAGGAALLWGRRRSA